MAAKGSVNSGAGSRVRAVSVRAVSMRTVSGSRRRPAVSGRPAGSAGAGAAGRGGASAGAGWFCGVRFLWGVRFFGGAAAAPATVAPPSQAGTLSASAPPRDRRPVEVLGRDEQLLVSRATALGGHDRPGRISAAPVVDGLAPAVGVDRRLRPGVVRREVGDRVPPVRDDAGRVDPLVARAVDRLGGVLVDS